MTISSMGGFSDDDSPDPASALPSVPVAKSEVALVVAQTILRLILGFAFIVWVMSLAPTTAEDSVIYPAVVAVVGSVAYALFFRHQLKGVYKARYPTLRAAEALVLTAAMFLAIFAMIYTMISLSSPDAFSEELDSFSAYYYALTVLATVGFGDIAPNTVPARSVTMVQMALDIAFIAILIRVMGGAAKKAIQHRAEEARATQPTKAPPADGS